MAALRKERIYIFFGFTKRVDRKAPSTFFYKFICIFEKCQKKVQIQIQDGFFLIKNLKIVNNV